MTDSICDMCAHSELVYDKDRNKHDRWCSSPQIIAASRYRTRCVFERDEYPGEHNRDTPETRKCGRDHLNFKMRDAA